MTKKFKKKKNRLYYQKDFNARMKRIVYYSKLKKKALSKAFNIIF